MAFVTRTHIRAKFLVPSMIECSIKRVIPTLFGMKVLWVSDLIGFLSSLTTFQESDISCLKIQLDKMHNNS